MACRPLLKDERGFRAVVGRGGAVGPHGLQGDLHRARRLTGTPADQFQGRGIARLGVADRQAQAFSGVRYEIDRFGPGAIRAEDHVIHRKDSCGGRSGCHRLDLDLPALRTVFPDVVNPPAPAGGTHVEGNTIAGHAAGGEIGRGRHHARRSEKQAGESERPCGWSGFFAGFHRCWWGDAACGTVMI